VAGVAFAAPATILFAVYHLYPVARALSISFTDYRVLQADSGRFVGLENYQDALQDPLVLDGLLRAFLFLVLFIPGSIALPIVIALLLDRVSNLRIGSAYRVLLYIPAVIPAPLIFALWVWLYTPSTGLINWFLVDMTHVLSQRPLWIGDPLLALPAVVAMTWWWGLGQMTLFFWIGLRAINRELYEAARVEGASELQTVRYVSLPLLRPTILTWVIIKLSAFAVIVEMLVFRGTGRSLLTWARYSWETAFQSANLNFSYAATIGWIGAVIMVVLALVIRRLLRSDWV
jgi:multiple sugar transport system permease protein